MGNASAARLRQSGQWKEAADADEVRYYQAHSSEGPETAPIDPPVHGIHPPPHTLPWRGLDIVHRREEVFLDVGDELSLALDSSHAVLSAELTATVLVNCKLSGTPSRRLWLRDTREPKPIEASDAPPLPALPCPTFHACVDQARYVAHRELCFVPRNGCFELLRFQPDPHSPALPLERVPRLVVDVSVLSSTASSVVYRLSAALLNADGFRTVQVEIRIPLPEAVQAETGQFAHPLLQRFRNDVAVRGQALVWRIGMIIRRGSPQTVQATFARRAAAVEQTSGRLPDIAVEYAIQRSLFSRGAATPPTTLQIVRLTNHGHANTCVVWATHWVRVRCTQPHTLQP